MINGYLLLCAGEPAAESRVPETAAVESVAEAAPKETPAPAAAAQYNDTPAASAAARTAAPPAHQQQSQPPAAQPAAAAGSQGMHYGMQDSLPSQVSAPCFFQRCGLGSVQRVVGCVASG